MHVCVRVCVCVCVHARACVCVCARACVSASVWVGGSNIEEGGDVFLTK